MVFLNLLFLLSIIILPVTNGLNGGYRLDNVVAVIYGIHLTVIATQNALLWMLALRGRFDPHLLVTALFRILVFVIGTAIATVSPAVVQFVWCLAFRRSPAGSPDGARADLVDELTLVGARDALFAHGSRTVQPLDLALSDRARHNFLLCMGLFSQFLKSGFASTASGA